MGSYHSALILFAYLEGYSVEAALRLFDAEVYEALGYFDPKPWHPDSPQYPKNWEMTPRLVNLWREEFPPEEMLKI